MVISTAWMEVSWMIGTYREYAQAGDWDQLGDTYLCRRYELRIADFPRSGM